MREVVKRKKKRPLWTQWEQQEQPIKCENKHVTGQCEGGCSGVSLA